MNSRIPWAEWRWAMSVALAVVVISTFPYAAGHLAQTPGLRFCGAVFDLEGYYSYQSRMWQGYRGAWQFKSLFTPEPHEGVYSQPLYIALGHLARLLGLGLPLTYHLARGVLGFLMLLAIYRFVALFAEPLPIRQVTFVLAATSSGLGWLVEAAHPTPLGGISPIDFWLVDAYTFFSLFTFPHFSAAVMLLLLVYAVLLRLAEQADRVPAGRASWVRKALWAACLSWGLGLIHPYALLLADLVPALYAVWYRVARRRWPRPLLAGLALMGLAQAPLLAYDYHVFASLTVFRAWAAQNVTLSPPPLYYCLGYGLVAILAAWGVRPLLRASRRAPFLLLWIAVVFTLAYLPWGLQRRFVEGVHVGLCVLAGYGLTSGLVPVLAHLWRRVGRVRLCDPRRLGWTVQALVLVFASVSNLYLVAAYTFNALAYHPALFHTADEVAAASWLKAHTEWDETVLAAYDSGNWIAGTIGHRVVLGHWAETVDVERTRRQVAAFYAADTPAMERRAWLSYWGVHYVYVGPEERALGSFDPAGTNYLQPVFRQGEIAIYRVVG